MIYISNRALYHEYMFCKKFRLCITSATCYSFICKSMRRHCNILVATEHYAVIFNDEVTQEDDAAQKSGGVIHRRATTEMGEDRVPWLKTCDVLRLSA